MTDDVGGRLTYPALWLEIERASAWGRTVAPWWDELELFLNPADSERLGSPTRLLGLPVGSTIGVPEGQALIFDRRRTRYIRTGEKP